MTLVIGRTGYKTGRVVLELRLAGMEVVKCFRRVELSQYGSRAKMKLFGSIVVAIVCVVGCSKISLVPREKPWLKRE